MNTCASAQFLCDKIAEKYPYWDIERSGTTFCVNLAEGFKISVNVPADIRPKVVDVALFHNSARVENQFGYDDNNKFFSGEDDVYEPSVVEALCNEIQRVKILLDPNADRQLTIFFGHPLTQFVWIIPELSQILT